ncbi:LuxR C-terminal-related transcriptional regulator [Pseudoalteromonas phenolica]|uniref:LuxR C-terminal-related transcriptional regulator n=1 Tax=Pseudoalteromonas phenolica TaxID=161398 RepID=UPI0014864EEA|nr:LuxR C-terminal-related transcriptional regulator [Pseudoalteromonas phenolica]
MLELESLKNTIQKTTSNIESWQEVLHEISRLTGVKKGIITLRDRATAELFIPTDVQYESSSPLLYGFSSEEVGSYVTHYARFDPWTEFEKLYHPSKPYALSKYIDQQTLQNSEFWQWLKPQGISDTIVLDIGSSSNSWVAMNLYFLAEDTTTRENTLAVVTELQEVMVEAWEQGLLYRMSKAAPDSLLYFLNQQANPSILIDSNSLIVLENKKATKFLKNNEAIFKDVKGHLKIKNIELKKEFRKAMEKLKESQFSELAELVVADDKFLIKFALIEKAQNAIGEDKGLRLITVEETPQNELLATFPIWENPKLSKRERQLVELLANGNRVVDFYTQYNLKKSTGHFHWANVKEKLNVKDRSEIYAKHQLFNKTYN